MFLVKRDRENLVRNPWFDEAFMGWPFWSRYEEDSMVWSPRVDVRENPDEIVVKADVPGMDKKDLKISVENNLLTIKGERKSEVEEKEANIYRSERHFGAFQRTFSLSSRVKSDAIRADYKDGVLTIVLPKVEEVKPRQIEIN
ncbi:MAG TPA: Hsp20/alpha crystallin family protein [bacterium]|nr:Hsp20/alpha crystallin family protein [bacterium]HQI47606.1 Hsp20/alpha crystallin family protein [bacterium]HQJ64383.1 Hsp20/alpha crystallin family protein [bacterium]HQJ65495.1 Hsp20/alpha crystallin family protein [bacterium]